VGDYPRNDWLFTRRRIHNHPTIIGVHVTHFSPSSVQFKSEINGALLCKRHQQQHLDFLTAFLRTRRSGVRIPPGAPFISLESDTCSHFQRRLGFDFRSVRSDNGLLEWNFETPNRLFPPILCGISCPAESCRDFFLRFSGERVLDNTVHGQILERTVARDARVYVTGLLVAQEERFAFSHNITSLTTAMRRALNRERTNVGRHIQTE
jgi:hypothetical protein